MENRIIRAKVIAKRDNVDMEYLERALSGIGLSGSSSVIEEYEEALTKFFGVKHAIAVSSGTAAIHCALAALSVERGDEVILPVTAPVMTALPIIALDAKPVFVDTQENSFGISKKSLEKKISRRTKCVISVPMWGYPTNIEEISQFTLKQGIPLVEDAAQAIATKSDGKFEGTFGTIGCFSTHEVKLISTGEGGFLITEEEDLSDRVREFSRYGMTFRKTDFHPRGRCGFSFGLNYKLNSLAALLGLSQISKLPTRLKIRENNAQLLKDRLSDVSNIIVPFFPEDIASTSIPNNYALIYRFRRSSPNLSTQVALELKRRGIYTDFVEYDYQPLYNYPLLNKYLDSVSPKEEFSNAIELISSIIILPTHEQLTFEDINYISSRLKEVLSGGGFDVNF